MDKLTRILADAMEAGQNVYVRTEPEVLDFTDPTGKSDLTIFGSGGNVVSVTLTAQNIPQIASILKISVFAKGMKVIAWNWKALATYLQAKTGQPYLIDGTIVDLKIIEAFAGITDHKAPNTLAEALNRLKSLVLSGAWKEIQPTYQRIHVPLLTTVIPAIEVGGVVNTETAKKVHPYYEICGQENGRLNCSLEYQDGFLPHNLGEEAKKKLKPLALEELFMYFDFKNMEVSMLQWLSKDERLGEVLQAPDVYLELYRLVTGIESQEKENRNKAKKLFLPVIYGQSVQSLGHRLKIASPTAEKIVTRIKTLFPDAVKYVESFRQTALETGWAKDMFGKRRQFKEAYDALNFSVQAPGATLCLEKLVNLYYALKGIGRLSYSVHDGYCISVHKDKWKKAFKVGHDVLTGESDLCPGLRLKVACHAGRNLDSMKPLRTTKGA